MSIASNNTQPANREMKRPREEVPCVFLAGETRSRRCNRVVAFDRGVYRYVVYHVSVLNDGGLCEFGTKGGKRRVKRTCLEEKRRHHVGNKFMSVLSRLILLDDFDCSPPPPPPLVSSRQLPWHGSLIDVQFLLSALVNDLSLSMFLLVVSPGKQSSIYET